MLSGLTDKMRRASSSSASVGSMVGIIALMKAFVMLEERPMTLIVAGAGSIGFASYLRANYKIRTGRVGHFILASRACRARLTCLAHNSPTTVHAQEQRNSNYNRNVHEKCGQDNRKALPQDAQNGIPARPQGARRLKRTLGVRCRETGD